MIDNFAPQPYPLECSRDDAGQTWQLVIGWRQYGDTLAPLHTSPDGGLVTNLDPSDLRYRVADTRPIGGRPPAPAAAPTVQPARRERRAEAT
jgi:hypothetical protein